MNTSRLRPLKRRLTAAQTEIRLEKIARRVDEREAARLLARAESRRKK